ncbi:MAG: hypothetical protein JXA67_06510 [Micromonosporaceae bacterium]|nr:hypothetical protein [Micromonosporaceae bacterium]
MDADAHRAWYAGRWYPAAEVARGAAYELFATTLEEGFLPNPRPGASWPFRRFVHASEVIPAQRSSATIAATSTDPGWHLDRPLAAPVSSTVTWQTIHGLSQTTPGLQDPGCAALLAAIRRSATIMRGTSMTKILNGQQVASYLKGRLLTGFCYRAYDVAHLRTPADLASISGHTSAEDDVVFALRWRAIDPLDYVIPFDQVMLPDGPGETEVTPMNGIPASSWIGPQVLGTGFAPSGRHIIPEWMVVDLVSLPMPVGTSIVAFTPDGTEVVLYTYQPDQHAWLRMGGPKWLHLLRAVPSSGPAGQELFPVPTPPIRLLGGHQGRLVDAIADPPDGFRVVAKSRAERHPVDALARRTHRVLWQGAPCTVVHIDGEWCQVRLCLPDSSTIQRSGVSPVERGVYEAWAHVNDITDSRETEVWYDLP